MNVALVMVTKRCNVPEKKHEYRLQKDGIRIESAVNSYTGFSSFCHDTTCDEALNMCVSATKSSLLFRHLISKPWGTSGDEKFIS